MSGVEGALFELTETELQRYARDLGNLALEGAVFVCLYGELGAGKSTLARAACHGAGVSGPVPSPTFTLVNQYPGRGGAIVSHADLYRIESTEALLHMGWEALLQSDDMVLVEWADRADRYLPTDRWDIRLEFVDDAARRRVVVRACGGAPPVPEPQPSTEERSW